MQLYCLVTIDGFSPNRVAGGGSAPALTPPVRIEGEYWRTQSMFFDCRKASQDMETNHGTIAGVVAEHYPRPIITQHEDMGILPDTKPCAMNCRAGIRRRSLPRNR